MAAACGLGRPGLRRCRQGGLDCLVGDRGRGPGEQMAGRLVHSGGWLLCTIDRDQQGEKGQGAEGKARST
ncbi:MAG: hypothetical protein NTY37_10155 [Methanothrix sp.]|nr:hypothetical protein [Methanothrix sp.]